MATAKSPISVLQEIARMKNLPLPIYHIIPEISGYICHGYLKHMSATTSAIRKKEAKRLCAERILEILQYDHEFNGFIEKCTTKESLNDSEIFEDLSGNFQRNSMEPDFNAVGKLNEICSKNRENFPLYSEAGRQDENYIIECRLMTYVTQGVAIMKKRAKQIAAYQMLSRISPVSILEGKPMHSLKMEKKVVDLFKHFNSKTEELETKPRLLLKEYQFIDSKVSENTKLEGSLLQDKLNEQELREKLKQMGVVYKIQKMQDSPVILVLKAAPTKTQPSYTFIHSDSTYKGAVTALLQKAIDDIPLLQKTMF